MPRIGRRTEVRCGTDAVVVRVLEEHRGSTAVSFGEYQRQLERAKSEE